MHGNIFDQIKKEIQLKQQFFNSADFFFKNYLKTLNCKDPNTTAALFLFSTFFLFG